MLCGNRFGDRSGCRRRGRRGRESRRRVRPVRKEHGAVQEAGARGDRSGGRRSARARTAWRTPASRCRSSCREGVAHRRGRFHRVPGGRGAAGGGPRRRRRRRLAARRARIRTRCSRRDAGTSTSATPTRWLRCWPGSTWCVTRPRWSVPAWTPPTRPPTAATTISPPRCCWRRCSPPGCAVWCWRRRWWCTGRATTPAPSTGWSTRCRGGAPTSTPGSSSIAVRLCGVPVALAARRRGCPAAAAQPVRGQQDRAGALRAGVVGVDAAARWWRCATTTSTAPACRATPPIPGWPRSSARHWKRASRQGFSRTAGRCVTSCTSTTWPRRTCAAAQRRATRRLHGGQRLFRAAHLDPGGGHRAVRRARRARPSPVITGQYRSGDVRHIVADPARAERGAGFPRGRRSARGSARIRVRAVAVIALYDGSCGGR